MNYRNVYDQTEIEILKAQYDINDVRTWPFFPIVMPLKDGKGPVSATRCDTITWEVWDHVCLMSFGSFEYLPDAINYASRISREVLGLDDKG